jgi:hypothetical protein
LAQTMDTDDTDSAKHRFSQITESKSVKSVLFLISVS